MNLLEFINWKFVSFELILEFTIKHKKIIEKFDLEDFFLDIIIQGCMVNNTIIDQNILNASKYMIIKGEMISTR